MNSQKSESVAAQIGGTLDVLEKLADLKNKGVVTEEEFNSKKAALLDTQAQVAAPVDITSPTTSLKESGVGGSDVVPSGVNGFSWGALLLAPFWAGSHKLNKFAAPLFFAFVWGYWGNKIITNETVLLIIGSFLSIVTLVLSIYLAFKGRELAWNTGKFTDAKKFIKQQKIWDICGAGIGGSLIILFGFIGYDSWQKDNTDETASVASVAAAQQALQTSDVMLVPELATKDGFGLVAQRVLKKYPELDYCVSVKAKAVANVSSDVMAELITKCAKNLKAKFIATKGGDEDTDYLFAQPRTNEEAVNKAKGDDWQDSNGFMHYSDGSKSVRPVD